MTRFLNLASKALAILGVLTLMWTASGMNQNTALAEGVITAGGLDANGDNASPGLSCYPLPIVAPAVIPVCARWACLPGSSCQVAARRNLNGLWACCWQILKSI